MTNTLNDTASFLKRYPIQYVRSQVKLLRLQGHKENDVRSMLDKLGWTVHEFNREIIKGNKNGFLE